MSTLGTPPATSTSASETLAHVAPWAPICIWSLISSGDLIALLWGRQPTPCSRIVSIIRRALRSKMSRSSSRTGVSSSSMGVPGLMS